ncbi:hypothetical protein GQ42DRAFT_126814 [Ramicandelaber brevisporus]|nr:hypothetical protein GQ42DRAFT_126814 [Ramicandelaber brevisporus]
MHSILDPKSPITTEPLTTGLSAKAPEVSVPVESDPLTSHPIVASSKQNEDNDSTETNCSICIEEFSIGDQVRTLPCRHKFHASCIDPWLSTTNATCPLCKQDSRTPDEVAEFEAKKESAAATFNSSLVEEFEQRIDNESKRQLGRVIRRRFPFRFVVMVRSNEGNEWRRLRPMLIFTTSSMMNNRNRDSSKPSAIDWMFCGIGSRRPIAQYILINRTTAQGNQQQQQQQQQQSHTATPPTTYPPRLFQPF